MAEKSNSQVVKDVGKWEWFELLKKEDWWAIWLGFFILLAGVALYFPQAGTMKSKLMDIESKYSQAAQRTDKFKTIAWYQMYDAKKAKATTKYDTAKAAAAQALVAATAAETAAEPLVSATRPSMMPPRPPFLHGAMPTWRPATPRKRQRPSPTIRSAG